MRADGEELVAVADDDDVFVFDTARDRRAIGEIAEWKTCSEVGFRIGVGVGHGRRLRLSVWHIAIVLHRALQKKPHLGPALHC
jgi:hypothetical protein